jgi:EmrB/QacA subfamily drug resistance transporter
VPRIDLSSLKPVPESMTDRDRTLTFMGVLLALFLAALDQTIVATALPRIVDDLHGLERYAWVASAYLLASTVLVPIYGKLADMYSRKVIELVAVSIFLTGSVLCGVAGEFGDLPVIGDGMNQLIAMRAVQGLGAAGLFAMALIIIADLYPANVRGRYQGMVGAVFGVASIIGPLFGGFLTDHAGGVIPGVAGWRWVFYVNVPVGILALWFIGTRMPRLDPIGARGSLDMVSALLLMGGLVPLVVALQLERSAHPWTAPHVVAMAGGGAVLLVGFVMRSLRVANPVLDLGLFRNRVFSVGNTALFLLGATFLNVVVFLPLFMVNVMGVSATQAGASLIPLSLGVVLGATVAGQLVSRSGGYRPIMLAGGALLVVGMVLLGTLLSTETTYAQVTLAMVLCGIGIGPSMPLYTLAIQNAVGTSKLGQATSASQFFRQIGGTVGVAIMGTVLAGGLTAGFAALPADAANWVPAAQVAMDPALVAAAGPIPPEIDRAIRGVFAEPIAYVYRLSILFAVLAWCATWFIPELPLAETNEPAA